MSWGERVRRLVLALSPALLFGLYARAPQLAVLNYVGLVPWVVLLTDDRRPGVRSWSVMLGVYVTWLAQYKEFFRWGPVAGFGVGLFMFVFGCVLPPLLRRIHHGLHLPRTLTVPLCLVTMEWIRVTATLAHMDLFALGYSQAALTPLVQIADVLGVAGVSFLVGAVNGLVADAWFLLRDGGFRPRALLHSRRLVVSGALVLLGFAASWAYGVYRMRTIALEPGPRAALIQPNIRHNNTNVVGVHLTQLLMTMRRVEPDSVDLIVWPENAILDNIEREGIYLEDLSWLSAEKGAPLLVGALAQAPGQPGRTTNTAVLVDDSGTMLGRYNKQLLFPWSEYVPFEPTLGVWAPLLQRLHRNVNRLAWGYLPTGVAGREMTLLTLPTSKAADEPLPFAALICFENTYAPIPAAAARLGARFLAHMTSEGEVGGPLQQQLLWISVIRAIETRLAYLRVGNTGISCFIDPLGRIGEVLRGRGGATILIPGVLDGQLVLARTGPTLYARSHDAFAIACVVVTLALLIAAVRARTRARRSAGAAVPA